MRRLDLLDFAFPWARLGSLMRELRKAELEKERAERERDKLREKLATIKAAINQ